MCLTCWDALVQHQCLCAYPKITDDKESEEVLVLEGCTPCLAAVLPHHAVGAASEIRQ